MAEPLFKRLVLVGIGLIGSSVARIAMEKRELAAEIVAGDGASSGLGYLILVGQRTLQANLTIGAMLVIGVLGAAIDYGVRRLERRVVTWQ